jgi:hypothetical protein
MTSSPLTPDGLRETAATKTEENNSTDSSLIPGLSETMEPQSNFNVPTDGQLFFLFLI